MVSCSHQSVSLAGLFQGHGLKKQNQALLLENIALKERLSQAKKIEEENQQLREALELGLAKEFDLELVEVTALLKDEDVLLIDRGSREGIVEGMVVVAQNRVLVGQVKEVFSHFAKVSLITAEGESFSVRVLGSKGVLCDLERSPVVVESSIALAAVPLHDSKPVVGSPDLGMKRTELAFVQLQRALEYLVRTVEVAQPVMHDCDRAE